MKQFVFWTAAIFGTTFFALGTFFFFSEWWTVKINKETNSYPWGHINDNPWFYDNADLYANVMLTEGILMLATLSITFWFLKRKQKTQTLYSLMACSLVFVLTIINSQIK